jgi:hypothetical protein
VSTAKIQHLAEAYDETVMSYQHMVENLVLSEKKLMTETATTEVNITSIQEMI